MRRYYTRESYIKLIDNIRSKFGQKYVSLSSDFIVGFCEETEQEFMDTVELVNYVKYDNAFLFAYSMREKTRANRKLADNVSGADKQRRLQILIGEYEQHLLEKQQEEVGRVHLILVEKEAKDGQLKGKTDTFKRVIIDGHVGSVDSFSQVL